MPIAESQLPGAASGVLGEAACLQRAVQAGLPDAQGGFSWDGTGSWARFASVAGDARQGSPAGSLRGGGLLNPPRQLRYPEPPSEIPKVTIPLGGDGRLGPRPAGPNAEAISDATQLCGTQAAQTRKPEVTRTGRVAPFATIGLSSADDRK